MDASDAPQIIEHATKSLNFTPYEAKWVPMSARFVTVGLHSRGTGAIQVYELNKNSLKVSTQVEKKEGIKCATFGASDFERRHLATGDYSGNLNIWDLENLDKCTYSVKAHDSLINCIDGCGGLNLGYGAPELVTGSRDGCVKVWDPRQQDPVASLEPSSSSAARDCWAVAFGNSFNDDERCVCAGYDNGDVKLLDLRMNQLVWETNIKNGVVGLSFDRKDIKMNKMVITSLESKFRLYDMRTKHKDEGYAYLTEKAHSSTVWRAEHLPQNRDVFMTTGGNGTLNLYKYTYPPQRSVKGEDGEVRGVVGTVTKHSSRKFSDQPIVSFDWNKQKQGLCVMAALDQSVKVGIVTKTDKM